MMLVACAALLQLTGCRSDPYCNQAIANYRAEKLQLQDEYYLLKAQYEADMSRLGQPIPQIGAFGSSITPTENFAGNQYIGEVLPGTTVYSSDGAVMEGTIQSQPFQNYQNTDPIQYETLPAPAASNQNGVIRSTPNNNGTSVDPSTYIRKLEVDQIRAGNGELARLLIRPLDDRGDILPVVGDIKIRVLSERMQTVFEQEYSGQQVANWIEDRPGQPVGIHLPILASQNIPGGNLLCDIQYRTSDNRILKQRANLSVANNSTAPDQGIIRSVTQGGGTQQPNRRTRPARNVSAPAILSEADLQGDIDIQIGDELNFDSLDESGSVRPPEWAPDR